MQVATVAPHDEQPEPRDMDSVSRVVPCPPAELVFKGRTFGAKELSLVEQVVARYRGLSRQELANTVCELLGWHRPNGGLKTWECKELLGELEVQGRFELPTLRTTKPRGARTSVARTAHGEPRAPVRATVRDVAPVQLRRVLSPEQRRLWRELIERYHYLGHRVPFGAHLRYLIEVARPHAAVVGCLQVSSPAWRIAVRDRWLGWSESQRRTRLQRVVNNSRFLIVPWVEVCNLASHVLARMAREITTDWERAYGARPVLLETLVDAQRFVGTCYRAAGWLELGATTGRGRDDRHHRRHGVAPKTVFVFPLRPDAREVLRGER